MVRQDVARGFAAGSALMTSSPQLHPVSYRRNQSLTRIRLLQETHASPIYHVRPNLPAPPPPSYSEATRGVEPRRGLRFDQEDSVEQQDSDGLESDVIVLVTITIESVR